MPTIIRPAASQPGLDESLDVAHLLRQLRSNSEPVVIVIDAVVEAEGPRPARSTSSSGPYRLGDINVACADSASGAAVKPVIVF